MKFSYYTGCSNRILSREYDLLACFARDNGFSAIEPLQIQNGKKLFSSPDDAEQLRCVLDKFHLNVSCYSVGISINDDPAAALAYLKEQIRFAKILRAPYFHHTIFLKLTYNENFPSFRDMFNSVSDTLYKVLDFCAENGVKTLYEPHGYVFNGYSFLEFLEKLEKCGYSDKFGVCFDCGNSAFADVEPYEMLKMTAPIVKHVHIKDYKYVNNGGSYKSAHGKCFENALAFDGDMRLGECLDTLLASGYDGYFSTEVFQPDIPHEKTGVMTVDSIKKKYGIA